MRKSIFTLVMTALICLSVNAQTIGSAVQNNVALCSGAETTGGNASQPVAGATVSFKIVDVNGKVFTKTTTSMATMAEPYAGKIRQLKENGGVNDCWLEKFDSYVTTRWTNNGLSYEDQNSDGVVNIFLMYVLPDWAGMHFTAPFNYTLGQVAKEDVNDTQAPVLSSIYIDGSDLVFDSNDQNCFYYFVDNTGKVRVSFENRYDMTAVQGITAITAYAVDFSGNKSEAKTLTFDLTIGSMKIDNKQIFSVDGELANTSSPVNGITLSTRVVDVNGVIFAKTTANGGTFDGNPFGCQLRNNAGNNNIKQLWLSNANEDQTSRWNKLSDVWENKIMDFSIGSLMYPDEKITELYTLCLLNGVAGANATQAVEYKVGQPNSVDINDQTAPVISNVTNTGLENTKLVTVVATDADEIFYLIDKGNDGVSISFQPEFEVPATLSSIKITAYDYSGNVSSTMDYNFGGTTVFDVIGNKLPINTFAVNGGIVVKATNESSINIYSTIGVLVCKAKLSTGENFIPLNKGFYLVNSNKVLVK